MGTARVVMVLFFQDIGLAPCQIEGKRGFQLVWIHNGNGRLGVKIWPVVS